MKSAQITPPASAITEESILFGLRLEAPFRQRFHPYGTALFGGTKIFFKFPPTPTYTYDQASAFSLGGGIDFDVTRNFRAKFDYQQQFENFGPNGIQSNNADFTLTPARIHLRRRLPHPLQIPSRLQITLLGAQPAASSPLHSSSL